LVRNSDKKINGFCQELSGPYAVTDTPPGNTYKIHMPDRANKYNKLHINLLLPLTLESSLTEEVLHNNNDFEPDLLGDDGSNIADQGIFLERKERKR